MNEDGNDDNLDQECRLEFTPSASKSLALHLLLGTLVDGMVVRRDRWMSAGGVPMRLQLCLAVRIYSLMPVPIILSSYFMFHFNFTIICPQIVRSTFLSRLKREGGDSSAFLTRLKDSNRATAIDRFMSRLYQDQLRKFR